MELGVELFVLDGAALHSGGDGGGDGDGEGDAGAGAAGPHAGAAEQALRDKFAQARKSGKPAVLFIDEIVSRCMTLHHPFNCTFAVSVDSYVAFSLFPSFLSLVFVRTCYVPIAAAAAVPS
jgi:hypothetical protein